MEAYRLLETKDFEKQFKKLPKENTKRKKELKEQNEFLKHILRSLDDIKKGRVKEIKL